MSNSSRHKVHVMITVVIRCGVVEWKATENLASPRLWPICFHNTHLKIFKDKYAALASSSGSHFRSGHYFSFSRPSSEVTVQWLLFPSLCWQLSEPGLTRSIWSSGIPGLPVFLVPQGPQYLQRSMWSEWTLEAQEESSLPSKADPSGGILSRAA